MARTSNENICNAGSKMGRSGPDVNGRHEEQSRGYQGRTTTEKWVSGNVRKKNKTPKKKKKN